VVCNNRYETLMSNLWVSGHFQDFSYLFLSWNWDSNLEEHGNTIYILFRTSIHQFNNPQFFFIKIFIFNTKIIQPFLNLEGASKCISQHHWTPNFIEKHIRRLVKINWWIDVTNRLSCIWREKSQISAKSKQNCFFLLSCGDI
jgi:hypothetical protein